jgi:hypothetical protein
MHVTGPEEGADEHQEVARRDREPIDDTQQIQADGSQRGAGPGSCMRPVAERDPDDGTKTT